MLRFVDFRISTKIMVLLASLAVVSIGAALFATSKMRFIDNSYGDLIDGPGKANLAIARANRNLVYINRSIYRLLTEVTAEGNKQALKELADTEGFFDRQVKVAIKAMPSAEADIKHVVDEYKAAIFTACAETIRLGSSLLEADKHAAIVQMREKCDPPLRGMMDDISALTNRIVKLNDRASDDALAVTNATIRNTYIAGTGRACRDRSAGHVSHARDDIAPDQEYRPWPGTSGEG